MPLSDIPIVSKNQGLSSIPIVSKGGLSDIPIVPHTETLGDKWLKTVMPELDIKEQYKSEIEFLKLLYPDLAQVLETPEPTYPEITPQDPNLTLQLFEQIGVPTGKYTTAGASAAQTVEDIKYLVKAPIDSSRKILATIGFFLGEVGMRGIDEMQESLGIKEQINELGNITTSSMRFYVDEILRQPYVPKRYRITGETPAEIAQEIAEQPIKFLYMFAQNLPRIIAAIGATYLTKNPKLGGAIGFGIPTFVDEYSEFRKRGIPPAEASTWAAGSAVGQTLIELWPFLSKWKLHKIMANSIAKVGAWQLFKQAALSTTLIGAEGGIEEFTQPIVKKAMYYGATGDPVEMEGLSFEELIAQGFVGAVFEAGSAGIWAGAGGVTGSIQTVWNTENAAKLEGYNIARSKDISIREADEIWQAHKYDKSWQRGYMHGIGKALAEQKAIRKMTQEQRDKLGLSPENLDEEMSSLQKGIHAQARLMGLLQTLPEADVESAEAIAPALLGGKPEKKGLTVLLRAGRDFKYREFLKDITGKESTKDMSYEERSKVLDAMHKKTKRQKHVTPAWLFTSQEYYATLLTSPAVQEKTDVLIKSYEQVRDRQIKNTHNTHSLIAQWKKTFQTTIKQEAEAKLKNVPTNAERIFSHLFNKYEIPPRTFKFEGLIYHLNDEQMKIFTKLRRFTHDTWFELNKAREARGDDPIDFKIGYFPHILKLLKEGIETGQQPIPDRIYEKARTGKILNPRALDRELGDELAEMFTEDPLFALDNLSWYSLKDIYMEEPRRAWEAMMEESKKELAPRTYQWMFDFVNEQILGKPTKVDQDFDNFFKTGMIHDGINKVLRPFGRRLSEHPWSHMMNKIGRPLIAGTMGWRAKQIIRNKFQIVQCTALYGVKNTWKALWPAEPHVEKFIRDHPFHMTYIFEDLPVELMGKLESLWHKPFQWSAVSNVRTAMRAAYYATEDLITNPKYKDFGWASPLRTYDEPKGYLYPDELDTMEHEVRLGAATTQYHYIGPAMPGIFRYKALKGFTRLQSWWMNHFTRFHREAGRRCFKGVTADGKRLPWQYRINYLKYMTFGGAILNTMGYGQSFAYGALPTGMPPLAELLSGFAQYGTALWHGDREDREKAGQKIARNAYLFVPGSQAFKDIKKLQSGEFWKVFFYGEPGQEPWPHKPEY